MDDFPLNPPATETTKPIIDAGPYYLFIGRVVVDKGIGIARHVAEDCGLPLVVAGQGNFEAALGYPPPPYVRIFGAANAAERASLMAGAVAVINPTTFREPFGGTAVEAQLAGTPAITTDHGAFVETTPAIWRCASHREFVEAAERAKHLTRTDRMLIRQRARSLYSLEAVAPLYERYFQRIFDRWGQGWYAPTPLDPEVFR
jgi:glycosyltransferase involved in cell wall biosynthesis